GASVALMRSRPRPDARPRLVIGSVLLCAAILGIWHVAAGAPVDSAGRADAAGYIGYIAGGPLTAGLTAWLSIPLLVIAGLFGALLVAGVTVREAILGIGRMTRLRERDDGQEADGSEAASWDGDPSPYDRSPYDNYPLDESDERAAGAGPDDEQPTLRMEGGSGTSAGSNPRGAQSAGSGAGRAGRAGATPDAADGPGTRTRPPAGGAVSAGGAAAADRGAADADGAVEEPDDGPLIPQPL